MRQDLTKAAEMTPVDWSAKTTVQERSDGGSDLFYEFRQIAAGSLAEMVRHVIALPTDDRARLVIDAERLGSINIHDIVELSRRPDFPA